MRVMTARANTPSSIARQAKRADTTPKGSSKRGANKDQELVARATGINTSTNAGAALIDPDKPLSDKQRLFVKFWAEGDSIPGASRRAGYADSGSMAYRMVSMPNVLKLKAQYAAEYEATSEMSRKKVMDGFAEAIDMAKLMAEPASMIAGWREIAKMCGYMAPVEHKVKVDVTGNIILNRMNSMSDAELLKFISEGASHVGTQLLSDQTPVGEGD